MSVRSTTTYVAECNECDWAESGYSLKDDAQVDLDWHVKEDH